MSSKNIREQVCTGTPMDSIKMSDEAESSSDEFLDIKSVKFDPLKALYSPKLELSLPSAITYDNLSKYEAVIKGSSLNVNSREAKVENAELPECPRRRFLPHQEPVAGSSKARQRWCDREVTGRNVLTRMETAPLGPLDLLHRCMDQRIRVKVYTRGARSIRGYVIAYVAAFDKHWNLALEDCLEVWSRKLKRKAPALGPRNDSSSVDGNTCDVVACKIIVKETKGNMETLERHVPQLLVRGEQIALIAKLD